MTIDGQITDEKSGYAVVFEDDGRVAYGYLLDPKGKIVGDTWLYNRCETPEKPEWTDLENAPFANSAEYVNIHDEFIPVNDFFSEVNAEFEIQEDSKIRANILIRGDLFGVLEEGANPGWARLAKKDGPAARALVINDPLS